jgi:CubicO group peptidase (beta-lactamase class C family)
VATVGTWLRFAQVGHARDRRARLGPGVAAKRGPIRAAAAALAIGVLLMTTSAGTDAVGEPSAQDDGVAAVIARYQARIPQLMAQKHIPGLSLAVVDGDHVVWQEAFGYTDDDGHTPVTVDTIFSAESMSKVFTATAVMQAVQAGRLDLDAPITTYLPDFTVHSAFESHPERRITLRMLLSHTAGFTHEAPVGNLYEPEPGEFDAHVASISDTWLRFPVGSGYAYSNLGIDLAGYILEQVWNKPFPALMHDSLLAPLGMDHSTFDRAQVHATADRAVGHSDSPVPQRVDSPVTAAGGLWTSAADLATFLRFQLGSGTVDARTVLDTALMQEMRTIPAPNQGAAAGYALGVWRTRWPAGQYLDLFNHNGGGEGFLSELWWLPQLQLGIAVLTNSDTHDLQGILGPGILQDLVTEPDSLYHDRMLALPTQSDVAEPDSGFVAPPDLAGLIAGAAMPATSGQTRRWATYVGAYRTGEPGAMSPTYPPSRFHLESGVPYFDAAEEGTPVRHRLTEVQAGLFLSDDGETLDLRGPALQWRGVRLNRVTGGPLPGQWALLAVVAGAAAWWLVGGVVGSVRRHRAGPSVAVAAEVGAAEVGPVHGHAWRRLTVAVASIGAVAALASVAAIALVPGLVDVGFLGWFAFTLAMRLSLHLPLAVVVLAGGLGALVIAGVIRRWWTPRIQARDAALVIALTALATQMALWHLVGWGF